EWTCHWAFTLDGHTLVEEGWVVTHYFQEGDKYELKITLTHNNDATELLVPNVEVFPQGKIPVLPEERRRVSKLLMAVMHGNWSEVKKEWKNKSRRRSGRALDYLRLAMTLVIALFGLMAGAKEQLLKLD